MFNLFKKAPPQKIRKFKAQPDITAYELAFILCKISGSDLNKASRNGVVIEEDFWDALSITIQRHFVEQR